jgi:hypothetical protein
MTTGALKEQKGQTKMVKQSFLQSKNMSRKWIDQRRWKKYSKSKATKGTMPENKASKNGLKIKIISYKGSI